MKPQQRLFFSADYKLRFVEISEILIIVLQYRAENIFQISRDIQELLIISFFWNLWKNRAAGVSEILFFVRWKLEIIIMHYYLRCSSWSSRKRCSIFCSSRLPNLGLTIFMHCNISNFPLTNYCRCCNKRRKKIEERSRCLSIQETTKNAVGFWILRLIIQILRS